jgi:hypothetical protein
MSTKAQIELRIGCFSVLFELRPVKSVGDKLEIIALSSLSINQSGAEAVPGLRIAADDDMESMHWRYGIWF